jgi:hypothetical protein
VPVGNTPDISPVATLLFLGEVPFAEVKPLSFLLQFCISSNEQAARPVKINFLIIIWFIIG